MTPGYWRQVGLRLARDPITMIALVVLALIVLAAIFAPWVAAADPLETSVLRRLKPIGTQGHWLGTDEIGRDMWARIAYGGRLSLVAGLLPVAIALVIGGALGILAGYVGGKTNTAIMRVMDMFYAFPSVLLAVGICAIVGTGLLNTVLALSIVFVPPMARVAESVMTQVRSHDFIDAARASGTSGLQIVRHHVLANVAGPILVYATSLTSISMILAAGLSFLGLGVPPPAPEWGQMLNALRQAIFIQPWLAAVPGVMIFLTSLCFNLLSDGLRSALDVRLAR